MTLGVSTPLDNMENSLDLVERILEDADWSYERDGYGSVHCIAPSRWGDLGGVFTVRDDPIALHFSVTLDVKPTPSRRNELNDLMMQINERMTLGYFDYWPGDDLIIFRHTIGMADWSEPEEAEVSAIIGASMAAVEKYTPSMNYVIWAGKTASEAMEVALFETVGEA
ncbi:type III secretion system chaperone family protein [Ponticaulis profundi]|uniref:YbjN domain-containing protein n=1 Tax=Ponticaulis profundi TaxID=2665222 RepID=A0ABW1SAJ3_9PROT